MNKKVYVMCDSELQFKEIVAQYKSEPVSLVRMENVGSITEGKSEVWDCRSMSRSLEKYKIEYSVM